MIHKKYIKSLLIRILLSIIIFLALSIFVNYSDNNLLFFKKNVYDKSLNFSNFTKIYNKYFGKVLPEAEDLVVNKSTLTYSDVNAYHNGAVLSDVKSVSPFKSGIVVFIGEKDNYGNTIIIQGMDGIDYWYGNVTDISIKLYDYVESDMVIANATSNKLYVLFMKNGEVLNFEEFI
ncbi:MAG: M23 family metallopeptidase [Bacilli bacterium]|nr:M23 family metallopeptidase [Bacilli bacterium]